MKDNYISGIYNYCDRWCERCDFTSRCRNYEGTSKLSNEENDVTNKAFWKKISSSFNQAIELLNKAAKEQGIDLNGRLSEEEEVDYKKRQSLLNKAAKQHQLSLLCKKYQKLVMPFARKSEGIVEKTRELVEHLHLGIKTEEDVVYTVADIGDCFDIIRWYLFFIDAKLQRALHGKLESTDWDDSGYPKDSDGSAKIAIIAIERSIGAWIKLYELMPSSEDISLNALSLLTQLASKTKEEFPDAMKFMRPGFDEVI